MRSFRKAVAAILLAVTAYWIVSYRMFATVWGEPRDGVGQFWFSALTEPMDGRRAEAYDRAVRAAWREGLVVPWSTLRQTNTLYLFSWHGWNMTGGAAYSPQRELVLIHTSWAESVPDDELVCVFAHEIGHAIQARRDGLADIPQCGALKLMMEFEADDTAALICGRENWDRFFNRVIKERSAPACP